MREFHAEGLASHGGHEPCASAREGGGEALVVVRAGRAIEPHNHPCPGRPRCHLSGRPHHPQRYRELWEGPVRSENLRMYGTSMHENREAPCPPDRPVTGRAAQGTTSR